MEGERVPVKKRRSLVDEILMTNPVILRKNSMLEASSASPQADAPTGSMRQQEASINCALAVMATGMNSACTSYEGPSSWILQSGQEFATFMKQEIDREGTVSRSTLLASAVDTLPSIARVAAAMALFVSDTHAEFGALKDPFCFWPRFRDFVKEKSINELANFLCNVVEWRTTAIPAVRLSLVKASAVSGVMERAAMREPCTEETFLNRACLFLRLLSIDAALEGSKIRSTALWARLQVFLKAYRNSLSSSVSPLQKKSMTNLDVAYVVVKSDGLPTASSSSIQARNLAFALLCGMRPGSIQRDRMLSYGRKAMETRRRYAMSQGNTTGDELQDVIVRNDETQNEEEQDEQEERDTDSTLNSMFQGMSLQDISIYRIRRRVGDAEHLVRIRVCVKVPRTKTAGYTRYAVPELGFSFPELIHSGSEVALPCAAVGYLLQSVLRGHVDACSVLSTEEEFWKEDDKHDEILISSNVANGEPFFLPTKRSYKGPKELDNGESGKPGRLYEILHVFLDDINVPYHLISPRSFRSGYAQSVVLDFAMRQPAHSIITSDAARHCLTSTPQWRSGKQASCYTRSLMATIYSNSRSSTGVTREELCEAMVKNSLRALLRDSDVQLSTVGEVEQLASRKYEESKHVDAVKHSEDRRTKLFNKRELKRICSGLNQPTLLSAVPVLTGEQELRELQLDLRKCVRDIIRIKDKVVGARARIHFVES